ncbi:hypothetical protein [Bradyrhizobium ottawaense]|uniref:hypothetical protein n=1 Tax=Bradyrhizobium ottawaense TaxID=931866 RepID=UPI00384D2736
MRRNASYKRDLAEGARSAAAAERFRSAGSAALSRLPHWLGANDVTIFWAPRSIREHHSPWFHVRPILQVSPPRILTQV